MHPTLTKATLGLCLLLLLVFGAGIFVWPLVIVSVLLAGVAIAHVHGSPTKVQARAKRPLLYTLILLTFAFVTITLVPLPGRLTKVSGMRRYHQNREVMDVIEDFETQDILEATAMTFSISRNRAGTWRVLMLLVAIFSVFELTRTLSLKHRRQLLAGLVAGGVAVGVLGHLSITLLPQGNRLWWFIEMPPFHRPPVGSFLNLNHYAGFLALLSVTAMASGTTAFRARRITSALLYLTASLIMASIMMLSASRGAMIAWAAGIVVLGVISIAGLPPRRKLTGAALIAALLLGSGLAASRNEMVRQRMGMLFDPARDSSVNQRINAWQGTLRLWTHYPIAGVGANAFRFTYPQHKDSAFRAYRRFAENEPLHMLAEGGLIGIALAAGLFIAIVCLLRSPDDTGREGRYCAIAALAVSATHASFDFILHLPLVAMTLSCIVATGTPQPSHSQYRTVAIGCALVIAMLGTTQVNPMRHHDNNGFITSAPVKRLPKLLANAPTSSQVWRRVAAEAAQRDADPLAEHCLELAATYDPCDFGIWIALGKQRLALDDRDGAEQAFGRAKAIRSWAPVPSIE